MTLEEFRQKLDSWHYCGISNSWLIKVSWPDGSQTKHWACSGGAAEAEKDGKALGLEVSIYFAR